MMNKTWLSLSEARVPLVSNENPKLVCLHMSIYEKDYGCLDLKIFEAIDFRKVSSTILVFYLLIVLKLTRNLYKKGRIKSEL